MIKLNIQSPDLSPLLRHEIALLRSRERFVKLWAQAAANEARANARAKGGKRYWRELARSVQIRSVSALEAEVSSNQPGAVIKQYGGVIRPKNARALTIPIAKEAYGKRASELEKPDRPLFTWRSKKGNSILGYAKVNKRSTALVPLFVLSRRSVQKPDPWFPDDSRLYGIGIGVARRLYTQENIKT